MLGITSIKLSALLKGLRRDQGRIWTVYLSTICASPVLPGSKMMSLSTEYGFLVPLCCSVLAFPGKVEHSRTMQQPLMVSVTYVVCCATSAEREGALGAAGQEPVVAFALSP